MHATLDRYALTRGVMAWLDPSESVHWTVRLKHRCRHYWHKLTR